MGDADLVVLECTLEGVVPTHILFEHDRTVFENRIVSIAYD